MKNTKTLLTAWLFIMSLSLAWADISVYFKNERKTVALPETKIAEKLYVDFDAFNQVFNSIVKQERGDHRLHLFLNGKQFIFLIGSPFYSFENESWNLHLNVTRSGNQFYLPSVFVTEHLPTHFKDMEMKGTVLQIERPKDRSVKVIVLDPGHGGNDPGAVGKKLKLREKEVNLNVCLKLKQMLEKELGITVLMTRNDDRFITLKNRTKFANEHRADLFVSVHTNASKNRAASGLETYYLSTALTSDARAVEALENDVVEEYEGGKAERAKYDALAFILSDLSQTEHLENSNNMALLIQQNLVAGTKSFDRGVKQANFYVLRGAFMPAVLIEIGFISNPDEEQKLANSQYQERLARTIFEGLKRFKFRYDRIRNT
ncbi:MAG TPA: N-acetylmuramoyl-L-alanine amidase [Candidatus Cloacimonadota bacterium]|nr:N-acetylmuramoyl-L-alanine amidase [Candidatus Cloacimonadota bacterium]HOH79556.1 N-acetylmuramoyl-L-alanine amidase [Candidatus Cloacimonadota bacterium]